MTGFDIICEYCGKGVRGVVKWLPIELGGEVCMYLMAAIPERPSSLHPKTSRKQVLAYFRQRPVVASCLYKAIAWLLAFLSLSRSS
jgi:hypothetical protein